MGHFTHDDNSNRDKTSTPLIPCFFKLLNGITDSVTSFPTTLMNFRLDLMRQSNGQKQKDEESKSKLVIVLRTTDLLVSRKKFLYIKSREF